MQRFVSVGGVYVSRLDVGVSDPGRKLGGRWD
jgi:hypothetical protein